MGYPYNGLIPPAILLMNPGINREKFIELLDQTHSSHFQEYKQGDKWDHYDKKIEDSRYHEGLNGLAKILALSNTDEYEEFQETSFDENKLAIEPPFLLPVDEEEKSLYKLQVVIHEKNIIGRPELRNDWSWDKLNIGDIWEECQCGIEHGFVTKIFEEEFIGREEKDDEDPPFPQYRYKMKIKPIQKEVRREQFVSEEELYEKWPQFHPDFVYNWSQERGIFPISMMGGKNFLWKNKGGCYSLDEETFNRIPVGFTSRMNSFGYTDLILTVEALKHNAWKLLSRRGLDHLSDFLKDFPEVKKKYEKAIWDAYTSTYAKNNNLTVTEFLRGRIQPPHFFNM